MKKLIASIFAISFVGCVSKEAKYPQVSDSVEPGTTVSAGGKTEKLYNEGGNIKTGKPITGFVDDPQLAKVNGRVAIINVVPSIDTPVCEQQVHILGEDKSIDARIARVTLSRDLPMAQARFAKESKLTDIIYISDFKDAHFGKLSGLLMENKGLLARAVIVVDQKGIIRHLQVVPNVATLPDMKRAVEIANSLL